MEKFGTIIFIFIFSIFNSSFSQSKEEILPVELIYFEAQVIYGGVLLRWGTATEVNNFGFEIQRADSSFNFIALDFIPGSGNSNSPKHYFYIDTTLLEYGIYHYRLKVIDIDGYFDYSDTVDVLYQPSSVLVEKFKNSANVIFVNESRSKELVIKINDSNEFDEMSVIVYNVIGEKLFEKTFSNMRGTFHINYSFIPNGVYFISLQSKNMIIAIHKFIVLH